MYLTKLTKGIVSYGIVIGFYYILFSAAGPELSNGLLIMFMSATAFTALIAIVLNNKLNSPSKVKSKKLSSTYLFGVMPALCLVGYFTLIPILVATVLFELLYGNCEKVAVQ